MLVSDFDYHLPPESIAQVPLADRAASRMLHLRRPDGADVAESLASPGCQDRWFREFPDLLRADDLLVLNNTRVFPARLYARRSGARAQPVSSQNPAASAFLQGRVEVLLTHQLRDDPNEWECLVRPGRKIGIGEKLHFGVPQPEEESADHASGNQADLEAEVIARGTFGERVIRFSPVPDFFARVERLGHIPLPPYIDREDQPSDHDRYQTVYAKARGSVAAPTAGLHFTPEILERIRVRGIEVAEITLHVGLGTFQPVRVEKVEDHKLHRETYEISSEVAAAINRAKNEYRRIVAVGTTTVRTLEDAAERAFRKEPGPHGSDAIHLTPGFAEAEIFIYPGRPFRLVNALLTNFHLPQSTLLMLVCALGGQEAVLQAYRHAVKAGYRFYSYGDCMFVE